MNRLFLGLEVNAPWPSNYPAGRMVENSSRHITLAFLGNVEKVPVLELLKEMPTPPFSVGTAGFFDHCLFLPQHRPHVVSWHVHWLDNLFTAFQQELASWWRDQQYEIDRREFLPHVTVARSPFTPDQWKQHFQKLPLITSHIHLYQSMGNLVYQPQWTYQLTPPFEEIDHTADKAFNIYGHNLQQLHQHAQIALAFLYPPLLNYLIETIDSSLDDIIIALNDMISLADQEISCPLKAVSFHGKIEGCNLLKWEMIVDV